MSNVAQRDTENIPMVAPGAGVVSGVPIQIGQMLVLPLDTAASGEKFAALVKFHICYEKAVETVAAGDDAYWDPTGSTLGAGCFTKTDSGSLLRVGKFTEAQATTTSPAWVAVDGGGAATLNTADIATVATMASAAAGAKKVLRSAGASRAVVADGPDYDLITTQTTESAADEMVMVQDGATGRKVKASTTTKTALAAAVTAAGTALQPTALVTATATTDAVTCNGNEILVTTKAFTTAPGGTETLVITNSSLVAGKAPLVQVLKGTNTKDMSIDYNNSPSFDTSAHTITVKFASMEDTDTGANADGTMLVLISLRGVAA